jgi:hypothetical protein
MKQYNVVQSDSDKHIFRILDAEFKEVKTGNNQKELEEEAARLETAYKRGLKKGIWWFSWWKDGTQYIGAFGETLKSAYVGVDDGSIY